MSVRRSGSRHMAGVVPLRQHQRWRRRRHQPAACCARCGLHCGRSGQRGTHVDMTRSSSQPPHAFALLPYSPSRTSDTRYAQDPPDYPWPLHLQDYRAGGNCDKQCTAFHASPPSARRRRGARLQLLHAHAAVDISNDSCRGAANNQTVSQHTWHRINLLHYPLVLRGGGGGAA